MVLFPLPLFCHNRVIREEGGKMYMGEKKWKQAYEEFYEGFRGYQVRDARSSSSVREENTCCEQGQCAHLFLRSFSPMPRRCFDIPGSWEQTGHGDSEIRSACKYVGPIRHKSLCSSRSQSVSLVKCPPPLSNWPSPGASCFSFYFPSVTRRRKKLLQCRIFGLLTTPMI